MAYQCPRCGQPVRRGYSSTAQHVGGLVGALFYAAFGSFQCPKCGTLKRSEFLPEVFTTDGSGSSERYWPQQRVLVRDDHTWRGQVNGIGGTPGVRRTFGVFLVGRDGQALLDLWGKAATRQRDLELTRLTRDIKKAQEVDVIVRSGRPSH